MFGKLWKCRFSTLTVGYSHEDMAIKAYEKKVGVQVHRCRVFLSWDYSFLGASPDGLLVGDDEEFEIVEVKCPYKHQLDSIQDACKDSGFHLELVDGQAQLRRSHDYYFQVTGQLAIRSSILWFCDLDLQWSKYSQCLSRQPTVGWYAKQVERLLLHLSCTWNHQKTCPNVGFIDLIEAHSCVGSIQMGSYWAIQQLFLIRMASVVLLSQYPVTVHHSYIGPINIVAGVGHKHCNPIVHILYCSSTCSASLTLKILLA